MPLFTLPSPGPIVLSLMLLGACVQAPVALAAEQTVAPAIAVRIDDYAAVPHHVLARATRSVSRIYADIGVDLRWLEPGGPAWEPGHPCQELTVIVLNEPLTARRVVAADIVGSAPGTETARGRLAYVFYDRLNQVSSSPEVDITDALSLVVAHELGHLLLPYGSHSEAGVMRGRWDIDTLRRLDMRQIGFTAQQAEAIRHRAHAPWPDGPATGRGDD